MVGMCSSPWIRLSKFALLAAVFMCFLLSPLAVFAPDVCGGSRQMDQLEVVRHSVERFGMAEEEISVRQQVVVEVLNHPPLGNQIEINEHVATKDDVEAFHQGHTGVFGKIQTAEVDIAANRRLDLQLLPGGDEIFLSEIRSQVASAISTVNSIGGV